MRLGLFKTASKAFEPQEALRILKKIEIHHTPKHGSWLNMAVVNSVF